MNLMDLLLTLRDLALVILGFGFIVFIHELGHFAAARWAKVRVLAFAMGFGPALVSWRRGMGLRFGSSERAYQALSEGERASCSPTEYRLNCLPLGGYVKMLGQDDANPLAHSSAPDSYTSAKPGRRMVIISAGVVANILLAAAIFMVVFMVGLRTEPARVGDVAPSLPAAQARAVNAGEKGVVEPGLHPGDDIISVNGRRPLSFNDLTLATLMSSPGQPVRLGVLREGVEGELVFNVVPRRNRGSGLLEIGVIPADSARVYSSRKQGENDRIQQELTKRGLGQVRPGMELASINGVPVRSSSAELRRAFATSGGTPVTLEFTDGDHTARVEARGTPEYQVGVYTTASGEPFALEHLFGLTGVMKVASVEARGRDQGLQAGDIFLRVGNVEFPSMAQGAEQIRAHKGKTIEMTVLRVSDRGGEAQEVQIRASVSSAGIIGFTMGSTAAESTLLAMPPESLSPPGDGAVPFVPAARGVVTRPGTRIVTVGGVPVSTLDDVNREIRALAARSPEGQGLAVSLGLAPPVGGAPMVVDMMIPEADADAARALGWNHDLYIFEPERYVLAASNPVRALGMGVAETHRVMMMTYMTFARLFQGTVKVEHLKGPVGIAHLGTRIADRGLIWMLFFMGLISVNLAVVNFLPLPVVDGGQFLMILVEKLTGRAVPVAAQAILGYVGLAMIGVMFIVVTFNDIVTLFKG